MMLEEISTAYNPWCLLQQPVHPVSGTHPSFRTLLAAIDQGWQVVEPIQVLPSASYETWMYYWTLTHPNHEQNHILLIPVIPEVERLIEQSQYQVIEGSYY